VSSAPVPSQRSNNAVWWILGIVGGGIVLLTLSALSLATLIIHHVNVKDTARNVDTETPVGEIMVNKAGLHATGLPVYPGAAAADQKSASVEINANNTGLGIATESYATNDPLTKVEDWYRKRLGTEFRLETGNNKPFLREKYDVDTGDHAVAFVDDRGDAARVVALDNSAGGTKIKLVRAGKKEVQ